MSVETVVWCRCDERTSAHIRGEFLWSYTRDSWYFPDVTRDMNWRARYYADKDRTGEPYQYYDCPFCGLVLPGCDERDGETGG